MTTAQRARFGLAGAMPALAMAAILPFAGCGGSLEATTADGLACIDDSAPCIAKRQSALKVLVADQDRAWIKDKPTAHAYASGVRLFAFRAKKTVLSCDELALARREAEDGPRVLKVEGANLTPAQVSRGTLLAKDVARELAAEQRRRCA